MARAGHKYPLIVYRHMVNRWWPAMIAIGLGMFALAYSEYIQPISQFMSWRWQLFAAIGGLAIVIGIFFWIMRFFAYVQPYPTYLKLVTPFIRINISCLDHFWFSPPSAGIGRNISPSYYFCGRSVSRESSSKIGCVLALYSRVCAQGSILIRLRRNARGIPC